MFISCRKDNGVQNDKIEAINQQDVKNWIQKNPASQLMQPDWEKFKVVKINGDVIAKVPITRENLFSKAFNSSVIGALTQKLSSTNDVGDKSANNTEEQNNDNPNYSDSHPPEMFFKKDAKGILRGYLLNFIPKSKTKESGENGMWTGKAYEWNMTGDTLIVTDYVKTKAVKKQFMKVSNPTLNNSITLDNSNKAKLSAVNENQTASIWTWLGGIFSDIWQGINFVGYYLGIPGAWINNPDVGGQILIRTWDWSTDNQQTINYIAADYTIYGLFFNNSNSGYTIPQPTLADNLILLLGISNYSQQQFLVNNSALQTAIDDYLTINGRTQENLEFANWAVMYLDENRSLDINAFFAEFFPTGPEIVADPDANNWTDPDNVVLVDPDQTVYQEYQDNQPWPTITSIINYDKFVPNRYIPGTIPPRVENCFILAKEQLAKKGYTVGGYYVNSPQIFQAYNGNTVNLTKTREGISYIINALTNSIPVLVGVDVRNGSSNADNTTDHFIVIVGMGTDSKGKYFQFYDSSTNYLWLGASKENKLYFDSTTGKISGKTKSQYANLTGHHDFLVTQIRKSIKK